MNSNAFKSLQSLLSVFSSTSVPICRYSSAEEIDQHLQKIEIVRAQMLTELAAAEGQVEPLKNSIGIPIINYFVDAGAVISVSAGLQCALSEILQKVVANRKGLSQEDTHLLVDLWGQVEASKALYEFTVRHSEEYLGANSQLITVDGLKAQYRVLLTSLEQLILALGMHFGERASMVDAGRVVDWGLRLLKNSDYQPLANAIDRELYGLVA